MSASLGESRSGSLRKIVTVNTVDQGGGAEVIAWELFQAYEKRGLDSWLVVGDKKSEHEKVMPFYLSPYLDYRPYAGALSRQSRRVKKWLCARTGVDDFEFPYARRILEITGSEPGLVHCHNLHGGYFDLRALSWLSKRVPVVITLHDEWLLTGRCAASWDCERWRAGCGACPDLARPPVADRDATAFNWWRKARIYEKSRLYVIAPSQRILDQACQSMLTPAIADARVIPNGVDLTLFSPGDPALSRNLLPEPARNAVRQPQGLVMVTVTSAGGDNPYKDWPCLRRALEMLPWQSADGPLHLIVVGGKVAQEQVGSVSVHHVGYLRHAELVHCYRAADLFVHATKAETFGLAVVEAMACGLPVVVTDVGATAEVTGGGRAGCLTPVGDASAMARALSRFLTDADLRRSRGEESLRLARERSCREAMADAHLSYYNEITSGWRMTTGA